MYHSTLGLRVIKKKKKNPGRVKEKPGTQTGGAQYRGTSLMRNAPPVGP